MIGSLAHAFVSPLGSALLFALLGGLMVFASLIAGQRHASVSGHQLRRAGSGFLLLAWVWLAVWSMPIVSDAVRGWWEWPLQADLAEPLTMMKQAAANGQPPQAVTAVVLGGGVRAPRLPHRPMPDLTAQADRVWHAARLYKAGVVQRIVLSGGRSDEGDGSEAEAMRALMLDLGVPDAALQLEERSTNTSENARFTAALLLRGGNRHIVLVTSALHMRRAADLFRRAGFVVTPSSCDTEVVPHRFTWLKLLPSGEALDGSGRVFKEIAGYLLAQVGGADGPR